MSELVGRHTRTEDATGQSSCSCGAGPWPDHRGYDHHLAIAVTAAYTVFDGAPDRVLFAWESVDPTTRLHRTYPVPDVDTALAAVNHVRRTRNLQRKSHADVKAWCVTAHRLT
ncbi:hypothetical protein [Nocardia suismassiliense]|uniref:hypothetical protein n=1 Tax=Nocardia suismassiliense TaxID=2077092 RepID=UPI00131F2CE3|nr:hypothetical protein [Nocardia suismassiliense]